jgi:hypothetical protein
MPQFDDKTEFVKAARARVADARALLDASRNQPPALSHTQGAKYIAGYAIECILKAYLINSLGTNTLTEAVAELRARERRAENPRLVPDLSGVAGHNLRLILSFTDLEAYNAPRNLDNDLRWLGCVRIDQERTKNEDTAQPLLCRLQGPAGT